MRRRAGRALLRCGLAALFVLLALTPGAAAQEEDVAAQAGAAEELTAQCTLTASFVSRLTRLTDGDKESAQRIGAGESVTISWTEEVPVQAEGMLTELEQLQTVVQDLLTLARMQAPGYTVERQVCSLSEILRDAGGSLAQLARKQGVEFALELPECDPARDRVLTHYDRMRQLVMILGENGIKYTKPGGRAGMRLEYRPEGPVVLVWDQGIGIPPEEQGRVFDRFYRGVNRAASPGEGLGLAIARQLSELLEAPVQLESTGPEGSLFSLRPPAAK